MTDEGSGLKRGDGAVQCSRDERKETNKAVVIRFAVARASRGGTIERM